MSRPRTPLKVLEARGALKKNPQRYRERLEQAILASDCGGIGPPPERWNVPPESTNACKYERWRAIWKELAPQIPSVTPMKRVLLELLCEQMDKFRTKPLDMKTSERSYLLQLVKQISADEGAASGGKKPEGYGGQWEAFG
jgi:hypothetical protein